MHDSLVWQLFDGRRYRENEGEISLLARGCRNAYEMICFKNTVRIGVLAISIILSPFLAIAAGDAANKRDCIIDAVANLLDSKEGTLSIPNINFVQRPGDKQYQILALTPDSSVEKQEKVVSFATTQMARSWPEVFLETRSDVVRDYHQRSAYLSVQEGAPVKNVASYLKFLKERNSIVVNPSGSIGITWARATRSELQGISAEALVTDPKYQRFTDPMETTLKIAVPRYYDSSGRTIVIESRSLGKLPEGPPILKNILFAGWYRLVAIAVHEFPELYDKPIIWHYADKAHVRLYRPYGFEVQEQITPLKKPIHYKGVDWFVEAVTPRRFEQNFFNLRGARHVYGLNQPAPVTLPDGRQVFAAPNSGFTIDANERVKSFQTDRELEITPGRKISPGTIVNFDDNGNIESIL